MTPARARALVGGAGAVAAACIVLGLAMAGGPGEARREQRDAARLSDLREIANAFVCHAEAGAAAEPAALAELSPACLSPARAAALRDPASGAAYRIERADGLVRVCSGFEGADAARDQGLPPFDPATGCVTVTYPNPADFVPCVGPVVERVYLRPADRCSVRRKSNPRVASAH